MKSSCIHALYLLLVAALVLPETSLARGGGGHGGGGGGGSRGGGGGGSRSAGSSSMRSSPSVSRPSASRPSSSTSASRSTSSYSGGNRFNYSSPGYNYGGSSLGSGSSVRPVSTIPAGTTRAPSANRTGMPVTVPAGANRVGGTLPAAQVQRPMTVPATRQVVSGANRAPGVSTTARAVSTTAVGTTRRNVPLSTARPTNYGSISSGNSVAGMAAVGLAAGAGVAAVNNNRSGGGNVERGTGPRGGDYASVSGPRGELGVIQGPRGGEAVVGQGPGGQTGAAVRGPRGNTAVGELPAGANRIYYGGHDYYNHGYYWYAPYYYNDDWYYEYRYPPVNYWYDALPPSNETVVVNNETYYYSDAVYYQAGAQDGKEGYVVVPPPATNSVGEAITVLQRACDFLGAVTSLTAEIDVTMDRYLETGDKVPVTGHRQIWIRQPDHMAAEATADTQDQRFVYDGKTFTMVDRNSKRTIGVGAPPRLEDMIPQMSKQYGKPMPFGDLLQRDAFDNLTLDLVGATYVGVRQVNGVECHQVAFTRADVDWELWVKTGDQPFPQKITITYKTNPGSPRFTWECEKWTVNEPLPDRVFAENGSGS